MLCVELALGTCVRRLEVEIIAVGKCVKKLNRTVPLGLKTGPNSGNANHYLIILYLCTYIPVS